MIQPLYTEGPDWPAQGQPGWLTRQDFDLADPTALQTQARLAEVDVVGVRLDLPTRLGLGRSGEDGLKVAHSADLLQAVEGVPGRLAVVAGVAAPQVLRALGARVGWLEIDVAEAVLAGHDVAALAPRFAELLDHFPGVRLILSFQSLHEAGATAERELAWATHLTLEWLRHGPSERIDWSFAVSAQILAELGKLRAARVLAANLQPGIQLHVRTGRRDLTLADAPNNLVRLGLGAVIGVLAGAATVHVDPFTQPQGADGDSLRLARNQQHLLRHESALDLVADPLAGSFAVENLARAQAEAAWSDMQRLQTEEGNLRQELKRDAAAREVHLVGVTRYVAEGGPVLEPAGPWPVEEFWHD